MDTIRIVIAKNEDTLDIIPERDTVGTQYDHMAKQLLFVRPAQFAGDRLLLFLQGGRTALAPIDLGAGNSWPLSAAYTECTQLSLQIAFARENEMLLHSGIVPLVLRASLPRGAPVSDTAGTTA